jgi:hypothetical protein
MKKTWHLRCIIKTGSVVRGSHLFIQTGCLETRDADLTSSQIRRRMEVESTPPVLCTREGQNDDKLDYFGHLPSSWRPSGKFRWYSDWAGRPGFDPGKSKECFSSSQHSRRTLMSNKRFVHSVPGAFSFECKAAGEWIWPHSPVHIN